jgi:tetratricopeptide (TPR) repeat protein
VPHTRPIALTALFLLSLAVSAWSADANLLIAEGEQHLKSGEVDEGLSLFREALEQDPDSSLAYTRIGGAQLLKQEYGPAIDSFRRAIMLEANNADAFVGMAVAYLHNGDYALALACLEEAKRIDPSKQARIDDVIAYLDQRDGAGAH